jgi:hypothetical protein
MRRHHAADGVSHCSLLSTLLLLLLGQTQLILQPCWFCCTPRSCMGDGIDLENACGVTGQPWQSLPKRSYRQLLWKSSVASTSYSSGGEGTSTILLLLFHYPSLVAPCILRCQGREPVLGKKNTVVFSAHNTHMDNKPTRTARSRSRRKRPAPRPGSDQEHSHGEARSQHSLVPEQHYCFLTRWPGWPGASRPGPVNTS